MRIIETTNLKTWAGSKQAESSFPHLIKSLICAVTEPEKLRFPSGDAVWVPGYDGVLVCTDVNRFIPTGLSVWELGTNARYKTKANSDYTKRTEIIPEDSDSDEPKREFNRSEITFVFVTPLVWKDKEDWTAERKREGVWRDVCVIDGVDLQEWLEFAPAVNLQFASELAIVPEEGLYTADQAWEEWSYQTNPPLSEELVVIGREEQEKQLIKRLASAPTTLTVRGDSPQEAWGFTLAAIRRISSEEERIRLYSRTIVADAEQVAGRLQHIDNLIIILKSTHGQVSGLLSAHGCHVIIPEGNDARSERNVIAISRATHRPFVEALVNLNMSEAQAERTTRACGRSITILQRQIAQANYEKPKWAEDEFATYLLPALLAGRWSERNESDCDILCSLFNNSDYSAIEGILQEYLWMDEPPLQKIGELWTLSAPVDAFQLLARRLTKSHLERFKIAFQDVFGTIDKKVEIPPDEWIYSDLKGEQGHSGWLRSGMAESLLLIAERGPDARLSCVPSTRTYAENVIRGLSGLRNDWRVLASIRDQYSRLMEAAPDPLLESLEFMIEADPKGIQRLFDEGQGIFGGGGMHTGILWGLETLAWSPEYLSKISYILAKLSQLDPGGRLTNRPINSLREIFLWWHPGTNASIEAKLSALDSISESFPDIVWGLLAKLLPMVSSSIAHNTSKPLWRDIGDIAEGANTRAGQLTYASGIVDRAIEHVFNIPERWRIILDSFGAISPVHQSKILTLLDEIAENETSISIRKALWDILRHFIHSHRSFKDASLAFPEDILNKFDLVLVKIVPIDSVERNRWLFDKWLPDLNFYTEDHKIQEIEVEKLRQKAMHEILDRKGINGIIELGTTCKLPGFAASSAVPLIQDVDRVVDLVNQAITKEQPGIYLAAHISGQAEKEFGKKWHKVVFNQYKEGIWSDVVTANLLICWPDERTTWDDAALLGVDVESEFWRIKTVFNISGSSSDQTYQINKLISAGRAAIAFDRIALRGKDIPTETMVELFDATFYELSKAKTEEEIRRLGINSHDMSQYLNQLRNRSDIVPKELARREYQALPVLGSLKAKGLTIHKFMADDPQFFVDVLCDEFLPAGRDKSIEDEPTEEGQARARTGYSLLMGMNLIPGQGGEKGIDEEILMQWINTVREKALENDRVSVADINIGEILAQAPPDTDDGGWPHKVIRNAIETLDCDDIDHGLMIKRFNMRGTVTKHPYVGGDQERAIADQYHGWANLARAQSPRTARLLDSIAKNYENDAQREDIRAEQRKLES